MHIEWSLVLFSLLAGCGGCAFAFVGLSELLKTGESVRFRATLISLIVVIVGGCFSVTHLAAPQNVMAAVWNIFSFSGISIELILIGIVAVLMIAYLVMLKRRVADTPRKVIGVLGIVAGLALAFFTGHGYVLESQAAWDSLTLPFAYCGTALAAGAFLYLFLVALQKDSEEDLKKMRPYVAGATLLGVVGLVSYIFYLGMDAAASEALVFWGGMVVCGIVMPALCAVLLFADKALRCAPVITLVGFAGALLGGLAVRCLMWLLGGGFLTLFEIATTSRILLGS